MEDNYEMAQGFASDRVTAMVGDPRTVQTLPQRKLEGFQNKARADITVEEATEEGDPRSQVGRLSTAELIVQGLA